MYFLDSFIEEMFQDFTYISVIFLANSYGKDR